MAPENLGLMIVPATVCIIGCMHQCALADLRDGGRVPALLRGPADPDLREDRKRKGALSDPFFGRIARPPQESPSGGPHEALRESEEWGPGY